MVADLAGHPPSLVGDPVIAMGLDPAIGTSACLDSDKITELNTAIATGMNLGEGASPILASPGTLNETTPIAMDMDTAAALDSDTDRDGITTATDNGGDMDLDPNIAATVIASNLEKGTTMPLDPNVTSDTGSDKMDKITATDTAKDSESLDPNIASDKGSDTVPIQLSASATAMASVTATHLKQTLDSDDNDSRFSKGSSSEENEFTDDDDVTKAKKKEK